MHHHQRYSEREITIWQEYSRVVKVKVIQLCLTLCNPMDCSPPGSSVHGDSPGKNTGVGCHTLLQEIFPTQESNPGLPHCRQVLYCLSHQGNSRILKWIAYPFSRESSQPRDRTGVSCIAWCCCCLLNHFSSVPSLGFSRQEHWSGLPFPSPAWC